MTTTTLSIWRAVGHGWEIFKNNKRTLVGSTFILMVAGALLDMAKSSFHRFGFSALVVWAALVIASVIIKIGFLKLALKLEDGEPATVRELWSYSKLFVKYFFTGLVFGIAFCIGLVLLVVPGLYILATYGFAPIIVIDEHVTLEDAFRRSAQIASGHRSRILGMYLMVLVLEVLGVIPFFLGLFITIPLTALVYVHVYRTLSNRLPEAKMAAE